MGSQEGTKEAVGRIGLDPEAETDLGIESPTVGHPYQEDDWEGLTVARHQGDAVVNLAEILAVLQREHKRIPAVKQINQLGSIIERDDMVVLHPNRTQVIPQVPKGGEIGRVLIVIRVGTNTQSVHLLSLI